MSEVESLKRKIKEEDAEVDDTQTNVKVENDDSENASPKKKVATAAPTVDAKKNEVALSTDCFVRVNEFKGKLLIDIRKYFPGKDGGEMIPGKKGISLNLEQWQTLVSNVDTINAVLASKK
jgi:hypothetical protein